MKRPPEENTFYTWPDHFKFIHQDSTHEWLGRFKWLDHHPILKDSKEMQSEHVKSPEELRIINDHLVGGFNPPEQY